MIKSFKVGDVSVAVLRRRGQDGERHYWRALRYEAKRQVCVWMGWATRAEAERVVAGLVASGQARQPRPPKPADDHGTVRCLLETWRASLEDRAAVGDLAASTVDMYAIRVEWLIGQLADVKVDHLDAAVTEAYKSSRLRAGAAPRTVLHEWRTLLTAIRWGRPRGLCVRSELPPLELKPRDKNNRHTPSRGDVLKVLEQLHGWSRVAFLLYFATGARLQELAFLAWEDLGLDESEPVLRITEGPGRKTGAREIPLGPGPVKALIEWRADPERTASRYVFGVAPNSVTGGMWKIIGAACEAAGVPRFTNHGIRRHVEDALADRGVDPRDYAALMGHSPETAMRHYRKSTPAARRRAVLGSGLGEIPEGRVIAFVATSTREDD